MFDTKCLAVIQGYWAGYYQSKKPRPVKDVLSRLIRDHDKAKKHEQIAKGQINRPEVDVDAFLEKERRLRQSQQEKG